MDVIQAKLTNEFLSVQNYSIDWVAWIALAVSILATVGTLWWQNHIRRKDLDIQRQEKKRMTLCVNGLPNIHTN